MMAEVSIGDALKEFLEKQQAKKRCTGIADRRMRGKRLWEKR